MMKFSLVLAILFQILHGSLSFQTAAPVATPSLFHQRQANLVRTAGTGSVEQALTTSTSRRQPLLASTIVADSAVAEDVLLANPWERVCTTVQTSTSQLNVLRQKIAKSGVATALSYSLVSNAFTSVAVSLAWYGFNMQTGLSPVSPGQWKPFLAWYGGFYAINSLLKPVRFMMALGVVPHTERVMATFQSHFGDNKKAAIASSTALLFVVSATMMSSGIGMASLLSGTPIFPTA